MRIIVCIPARMGGRRLPGKPLLEAGEKSLLQWTYEEAKKLSSDVIVLTPDQVIVNHCRHRSMFVQITEPAPNGTWRIADAVFSNDGIFGAFDSFVNWQVDEPLLKAEKVKPMLQRGWDVGTLVGGEGKLSEDVVRVTLSGEVCHWFSRRKISERTGHCGAYSISREALGWYWLNGDPPSYYATRESLEQLVWIERSPYKVHGYTINGELPLSINTLEDWKEFKGIKENG